MNMKPLTQYLYDEGLATYKVATVRVYGTCYAYKNLMTGEIKLLMLDTPQTIEYICEDCVIHKIYPSLATYICDDAYTDGDWICIMKDLKVREDFLIPLDPDEEFNKYKISFISESEACFKLKMDTIAYGDEYFSSVGLTKDLISPNTKTLLENKVPSFTHIYKRR